MRTVAVGRKNLFSEKRRAALGIAGIAVAVVLVLSLDGIFAGAMRQTTRYIDTSPADLFVSQNGVRNMHMTYSALPIWAIEQIQGIQGVAWAEPILYDADPLTNGTRQQVTYVIGYRPGAQSGPEAIAEGREPRTGEIVVDRVAADELGVSLGDRVKVLNRSWRISGLTEGMTSIVNSIAYIGFEDFASARALEGVASYVLVGTDGDASGVARSIKRKTGLTASTTTVFSSSEEGAVRDMSTELMAIMNTAAFLIGLVVVGLTLYAATLSRLREIGVIKALGAGRFRLSRIVISQAGWTVGLGVVIAIPTALGLGWAVERITKNVSLLVEGSSVLKASLGATALGLFGALLPLIKVMRVDPAAVFRRPL